jgi:ABC-type thiamin/hydroxymethylpyrimidine transport system permease subunit
MVPKEAAKAGLYSSFLGGAVAVVIFDVIWQIWDYQIGERQNSRLILAIMGLAANKEFLELAANSLEQSVSKTFDVLVLPFQLISTAVLAGIFGTISGFVSSKIMSRGTSRSTQSPASD